VLWFGNRKAFQPVTKPAAANPVFTACVTWSNYRGVAQLNKKKTKVVIVEVIFMPPPSGWRHKV